MDIAGRAGVLLQDVGRREHGLVFIRPFPNLGQAADVDQNGIGFLEPGGGVSGQDIRHPGGDAAIDDGGDAGGLRLLLEKKRILGEKGDVDDAFPGGDHGLKRPKTHESGNRAQDEVVIFDQAGHGFRIGEVDPDRPDVRLSLEAGEGFGVPIGGGDFEPRLRGQVEGRRRSDESGS